MPELDGEHIAGARARSATGGDGLLRRGGRPTNETEEASSPAAASLDGEASGPAQLAGAVAPPATLGFLLCSGLAVAGPRARAHCLLLLHRPMGALHGEGLHPSFLEQTRALVGEAA